VVEKGYSFSTSRENDGVKIDITIETTKEMVMSELLGRFAELSHAAYLEMAKVINEKKREIDEHTVMGINSKSFEASMLLLHDISAWFKGERYTIAIEVEPDGVFVKKYPKE